MKWMLCNYRFIIVFVILVIFMYIFFMSSPLQAFWNKDKIEGFTTAGYNPKLLRIWNSIEHDGKWAFANKTEAKIDHMFDIQGKKIEFDNLNCSISFWIYGTENSTGLQHIISVKNETTVYLDVSVLAHNYGLHIQSRTVQNSDLNDPKESTNNLLLVNNLPEFVTIVFETVDDTTTYRLYVDGIHKNDYTFPEKMTSCVSDADAIIALDNGSDTFVLKDVHVYNTVIDADTAKNLYNAVNNNNNPDEARTTLNRTESFQTQLMEGFVSMKQCESVIMPPYKNNFDFYENVTVLHANGNPCKYDYDDKKRIYADIGAYKDNGQSRALPHYLGTVPDDENTIKSAGEKAFQYQFFGLQYPHVSKDGKKVVECWAGDKSDNPLRHGRAVFYSGNKGGSLINHIYEISSNSDFQCSSDKPICIDHVPSHQYGMCGKKEKVEDIFETTYTNDSNPIKGPNDTRLTKMGLEYEDTLDRHFNQDKGSPSKQIRFVRFYANASWRDGTRVKMNDSIKINKSFDDAKKKTIGKSFKRLDFEHAFDLGNNGLTFSMWIKTTNVGTTSQYMRLFDFGNWYSIDSVAMFFDNKSLKCMVGNVQSQETLLKHVNDNVWFHVAWTMTKPSKENTCEWMFYVNGRKIIDHPHNNKPYPTKVERQNMFLGASNYWWDPHLNGCIGDVRIYQEALSPVQMCNVYYNPDPDRQ